jgi:hypothetical protein
MRESIGGTMLFIIVISFILLFTGIMSLTINHSKAFAVKDDIVQFINNNEGDIFNGGEDQLGSDILDIIEHDSYWTSGTCEENFQGYNREGTFDEKASICLKKTDASQSTYLDQSAIAGKYKQEDAQRGCYYEVQVFYKLDIPVMNQIFNFKVKGQSKIIYGKNCGGLASDSNSASSTQ